MLYMPTCLLQPGMKLACDIHSGEGEVLFSKGDSINELIKNTLNEVDIQGVYIESDFTHDVVFEDCMKLVDKTQSLSFVRHVMSSPEIDDAMESELQELMHSILDHLSESEMLLNSLYSLRDYDGYTYEHSLRVTILSILLGNYLKLTQEELWELGVASMLHDLGKLSIPIDTLNSKEMLSMRQLGYIRKHPIVGYNKAQELKCYNERIGKAILQHHEHVDGSGYPYGLKGDDISLYARIICCSDVYDALTSKRSYRNAWFPSQALDCMNTSMSSQFDASILNALNNTVIAYPEGSIVLLSTGELAVVVKSNKDTPIVRTISDGISQVHDLADSEIKIQKMGYEDKRLIPLLMKDEVSK